MSDNIPEAKVLRVLEEHERGIMPLNELLREGHVAARFAANNYLDENNITTGKGRLLVSVQLLEVAVPYDFSNDKKRAY